MPVPGVRTLAVSALAAAVAVRVTATQPLAGAYARIAEDPAGALRSAADGWTVSGTLGDATAQGLRDVPVAAFLWLTDALGVPSAGGRTLWSVLVLVLAAVGAVRLARARVTTVEASHEPWTPWVGAALFACTPVLVTTVQHAPGDGLVVALLPWVLAPLVRGTDGWRASAASAAWLGLAGAGTPPWALAALAAGLVTALATSRRPGGTRQLARWTVLAVLSSAWWMAAYVWEASYATDLAGLAATRLSADRVAATLGLPTTATVLTVLLLLGPLAVAVSALALRVGRDRAVVAALLGLSAVAAVVGVVGGGWPAWLPVPAGTARASDVVPAPWTILGGWLALAALVAWTPLVDHLLARLPRSWSWRPATVSAFVAAGLAVLALVSVAGPVLAVQEQVSDPADTDAEQWDEVAAWSETAPPGRVLVLPAVTEGRVEPAVEHALRGRSWIARDTLPLSGAGATTALDTALGRLDRGHDGAGTATALRHLGISYVLLRNDVPAAADRERPVALVRHALALQGASRVAAIGSPARGGDDAAAAAGIGDLGVRDPVGSLEIWALDEAADGSLHDGAPLSVAGDAGVVGDLADAGLADGPALVLGTPRDGSADLVSDSARRQDVDLRVASDPFGPVLGSEEPRTVVPPDSVPQTTASRALTGAEEVRASSSAADLDSSRRRVGAVATAAVDGNAFTAWQSGRGHVVGQWWEITFDGVTDLTSGALQVVQNPFASYQVTRIRLESDNGSTEVDVPADGTVVLAGAGRTGRLRVVATGVSGTVSGSSSFAISELTVPDLQVEEELVVGGPETDSWIVAARPPSFATCVPSFPIGGAVDPGSSETVCNRGLSVDGPDSGPITRVLRPSRSGEVAGRAWVRAVDSAESTRLAARLARPSITATASSVASSDLVAGPQAAADADPATAWRPSPEDAAPTLVLSWKRPALVSGVRVTTAARRLSSLPTHVVVTYGDSDRSESGEIGPDGVLDLPAVRTRELTLVFESETPQASTDSLTGGIRTVPIAVSEVEVVGAPAVRYDADAVEQLPCGSGPEVTVGGFVHETAVRVSARQVVEASIVPATLCDRPFLQTGEVRVGVEASFAWIPIGLVLTSPDGALGEVDEIGTGTDGGGVVPAGTIGPRPLSQVVEVDPTGQATLALAVPAGKGWTAVADGRQLPRLTVDGWAQAWQVPEGVSRVTIRYSSGEVLRWATGLAALGWVLVVVLALWSPARTRRPLLTGRRGRRDQAMVGRSTQA